MTTNKIVITNRIHAEVMTRLEQFGQVVVNHSLEPWPEHTLASHLVDATALMGFMTDRVDTHLLHHAPGLKIVACALKGFDNYDISACTDRNVWVSIVPDLLTEPTAELAIGLAVSLARCVIPGDQFLRTKKFNGWRAQFFGTGLHNSVVAVLGLGMVGQAIVKRLSGFGCRQILGVDPKKNIAGVTSCELEQALAAADYVFVALPLNESSINLLSDAQLLHCRTGQFIINVGRGSVVNEQAVADALEQGRLNGYAADVFACEDWGIVNRPQEIEHRLLAHRNTLFTPHLGSAVSAVRLAIEHRAADNIIAVLQGEAPPDAINHVMN